MLKIIKPELLGRANIYSSLERGYGREAARQFNKDLNRAYVLALPKVFTIPHIAEFLDSAQKMLEQCTEKDLFMLDIEKCRKIDAIGMLMLYKFISICTINQLIKYPLINYLESEILSALEDSGFWRIIISYMGDTDDKNKAYNSLHHTVDNDIFMYPQKLSANEKDDELNIKNIFLSTIEKFYRDKSAHHKFLPIGTCSGEIISNFWAHANDTTDTIVAARGQMDEFHLVLADNGTGLISSLKPVLNMHDDKILLAAINRGTSSKSHLPNSGHMGYGLFHAAELAKLNNGRLTIWSQGQHLDLQGKNKITVRRCGYWPGTIVSIKLHLGNPKGLDEIPYYKNRPKHGLKINYKGI